MLMKLRDLVDGGRIKKADSSFLVMDFTLVREYLSAIVTAPSFLICSLRY